MSSPAQGPTFVEVAIAAPVRRTFTYQVPEQWRDRALPGMRVRVPFGPRPAVGYIVATRDRCDLPAAQIKAIRSLPDPEPILSPDLLHLTRWIAETYCTPWGEALQAALPPAARGGRALTGKTEAVIALAPAGAAALTDSVPTGRAVTARQRGLLERLAATEGPVSLARFLREARTTRPTLERLVQAGWVQAGERRVERRPASMAGGADWDHPLTDEQAAAVTAITESLEAARAEVFLLQGVTGSGKTLVYLRAVQAALARGRTALWLVPEIALTPTLLRMARQAFADRVAIWHSQLSAGERRDEWDRIRRGAAAVVLGARSAALAPVDRLGIVIVDEEQEASYKQETIPRYHGRDLALHRAREAGGVAVLGSATPSVEARYQAETGAFRHLVLRERPHRRPLPVVEIVDLRAEFRRTGHPGPISQPLREALQACRDQGEQAILLLNRRGYAAFLLCRECGARAACPECLLTLTVHKMEGRLRCHHCLYEQAIPATCPQCHSNFLHMVGTGTQRVEESLAEAVPDLRVVRLDSDVARRRGAYERIIRAFERREHDVLLGTQIVAKGHDFPHVTLVGVLAADQALGLPDFRATERTFQLLTQVAGRAGRRDRPGRVLLQAYEPEHYALQLACAQDYEGFYTREVAMRRRLRLPPFSRLIQLVHTGKEVNQTHQQARTLADTCRRHLGTAGQVRGPAIAPLPRLKGWYRFQIFLRGEALAPLRAGLEAALADLARRRFPVRRLLIDVDPYSLL